MKKIHGKHQETYFYRIGSESRYGLQLGKAMNTAKKKIIIGISGASGSIYGIRLLEVLRKLDIETHLVVSKSAQITIACETPFSPDQVREMADYFYSPADISARISSGSFRTMGMVVAPCSIRTMGELASGVTSSLLTRAADVILKERKKLVLMLRETPLHSLHLRHMASLADAGAVIAPPVPAFYSNPQTLDDIINHTVGRVLDLFDIEHDLVKRWQGVSRES